MATTAFNTQAAVRRLRDSGVAEEPADAIVETIREAGEGAATRGDLDSALARHRAEVRSDILQLRADLFRALWIQGGSIAALLVAVLVSSRFLGS